MRAYGKPLSACGVIPEPGGEGARLPRRWACGGGRSACRDGMRRAVPERHGKHEGQHEYGTERQRARKTPPPPVLANRPAVDSGDGGRRSSELACKRRRLRPVAGGARGRTQDGGVLRRRHVGGQLAARRGRPTALLEEEDGER